LPRQAPSVKTSVVPAGTGSSGVSTRGAFLFGVRVAGSVVPAHAACTHVDPSAERAICAAGSMRLAHAAHWPAYLACILRCLLHVVAAPRRTVEPDHPISAHRWRGCVMRSTVAP
jgi:hypothetical protein